MDVSSVNPCLVSVTFLYPLKISMFSGGIESENCSELNYLLRILNVPWISVEKKNELIQIIIDLSEAPSKYSIKIVREISQKRK